MTRKKKNDWHTTQTNVSGGSETWAYPVYVIVGCDYTERREKIDNGSRNNKQNDAKDGRGRRGNT